MNVSTESAPAPVRTFTMKAVSSDSFLIEHTQSAWKFMVVRGSLDTRHGCSLTPYTIHIVSPIDGSLAFVASDSVYTSWTPAVQAKRIQSLIDHALLCAAAIDRASVWVDAQLTGQSEARVQLNSLANKSLSPATKRKRVAAFAAALVELQHGRIAIASNGYTFGLLVGGYAAWVSVVNYIDGTLSDRIYVAGDEAAYDGYNLTYTGRIEKITIKGVVIRPRSDAKRTRRLSARDFAFWNTDTIAQINTHNSTEMCSI